MLGDSADNFNHAGLAVLRTAFWVARVMLQSGGHHTTYVVRIAAAAGDRGYSI